jgi:hypothetical protein
MTPNVKRKTLPSKKSNAGAPSVYPLKIAEARDFEQPAAFVPESVTTSSPAGGCLYIRNKFYHAP